MLSILQLALACGEASVLGENIIPSTNCEDYDESVEMKTDDGAISILNQDLSVDQQLVTLDPEGQPFRVLSSGDGYHYAISPDQSLKFQADWEGTFGRWTSHIKLTTSACTNMEVIELETDPWWEGDVIMDLMTVMDVTIKDTDSGDVVKKCTDINLGLSLTTDVDSEEFGGSTLGCDGSCSASGFHVVDLLPTEGLKEIDCLQKVLDETSAPYVGLRFLFNVLPIPASDSDIEQI